MAVLRASLAFAYLLFIFTDLFAYFIRNTAGPAFKLGTVICHACTPLMHKASYVLGSARGTWPRRMLIASTPIGVAFSIALQETALGKYVLRFDDNQSSMSLLVIVFTSHALFGYMAWKWAARVRDLLDKALEDGAISPRVLFCMRRIIDLVGNMSALALAYVWFFPGLAVSVPLAIIAILAQTSGHRPKRRLHEDVKSKAIALAARAKETATPAPAPRPTLVPVST